MALAVLLALVGGSACGGSEAEGARGTEIRIAFFQDRSIEDAFGLVSPSFLGLEARLASADAGSETGGLRIVLEQMDTDGDPVRAAELARLVADDPGYVMAVAAPLWEEPSDVADILAEAGVPTVSLSSAGGSPGPEIAARGLWRRLVPDARESTEVLADEAQRSAGGSTVCVVGDGDALMADSLESCGAVVWTGDGEGAAELARSLEAEQVLLGTQQIRSQTFLRELAQEPLTARGVVAVCACANPLGMESRSVRDFASAYHGATGLDPGPVAIEGWDVGGLLLAALATTDPSREAVRVAIGARDMLPGAAGPYRFDHLGDLDAPVAGGPLAAALGTRWIPWP